MHPQRSPHSQAKPATYLDSNASYPLCPSVLLGLRGFLRSEVIGNPSSIHWHGRSSKRLVTEAKEKIALTLGQNIDLEQIVFTSSGTEANQMAIRSILEPLFLEGQKPHWILTPVEHDSVMQMEKWCTDRSGKVSFLPVDSSGVPAIEALEKLVTPETALISLLWVNNETGVITPLEKLIEFAKKKNIKTHIDAVQAWGKIPIDLNKLGADYVSFSAHKIGGLAGTGFLWIKRGARVEPFLLGKQEKSRRGGTENLLGILAAGLAATEIDLNKVKSQVFPLRDFLENEIKRRISGITINGEGAERVSQTLNISFDGLEGDSLLMALDLEHFSLSAGSACSSGALEPSHVLLALGRTKKQALASLRISLYPGVVQKDLENFLNTLENTVFRLRKK